MQNPQEFVVENETCLLNIPLTFYYYIEFHLSVQSKYTCYRIRHIEHFIIYYVNQDTRC